MITIGNTIRTIEPDGLEISVTINEIHIDPEWDRIMLYVTHSAKPDESTAISYNDLRRWFKEAKWEVVKAPAAASSGREG